MPERKTCDCGCGRTFTPKKPWARWASEACKQRGRYRAAHPPLEGPRLCECGCKRSLVGRTRRARFYSPACAHRAYYWRAREPRGVRRLCLCGCGFLVEGKAFFLNGTHQRRHARALARKRLKPADAPGAVLALVAEETRPRLSLRSDGVRLDAREPGRPRKLCLCGCRRSLEGRPARAKWATPACGQRARAEVKVAAFELVCSRCRARIPTVSTRPGPRPKHCRPCAREVKRVRERDGKRVIRAARRAAGLPANPPVRRVRHPAWDAASS